MQYVVNVQGIFYRVITADDTLAAIQTVAADIAAKRVPHFRANVDHNITIKKAENSLFAAWASAAPTPPSRFDTWEAPDGSRWIYDQPRGADGRYLADDPTTPEIESALQWQLILN